MKAILSFCAFAIINVNSVIGQWYLADFSYDEEIISMATKDSNLYVGTNGGGIFLSTDLGESWDEINFGLFDHTVKSILIMGDLLFASANDSGGGGSGKVFKSSDNGENWETASSGLPYTTLFGLATDGTNLLVGTHYSEAYLSTDLGESWDKVDDGFVCTDVLTFITYEGKYLAGTDNGIFISDDEGANWSTTDLTSPTVYAFIIKDEIIFAGTTDGIFTSINGGINWTLSSMSMDVNYFKIYGEILLANVISHGVQYSQDNGLTWILLDEGLGATNISSLAIIGDTLFAGAVLPAGTLYYHLLSDLSTNSEVSNFSNINIYPSVATSEITVDLPRNLYEKSKMEIYSIGGVRIKEIEFAGNNNLKINISDLPLGLYILKFNGLTNSAGFKFVKI